MKKEVKGIMIICDCCGRHYNDGNGLVCYAGDTDGSQIEDEALASEWIEVKGKHYCSNCYSIDNNGNFVTKDGHIYNYDSGEEINS